MQYDSTDSSITATDMAQGPFQTSDGKTAYVSLLRSSEDPVLEMVIGVSNVLVPSPTAAPVPTMAPQDDDPVLSTAAIIGIACGGGALLIICLLYFFYCRGSGGGGGGHITSSAASDYKNDDEPPLHVNIRDDEVSTLAGPTGPPTYGDQRYVKLIASTFSYE
jgi:hypothetical protein